MHGGTIKLGFTVYMVIDIIEINSFQRTPKFSVNIFVLQFKNNRKKKLKRKISLPPGNSCFV